MGGASSYSERPSSYDWSDEEKVTKRSARSYAADDGRVYKGYSSKGLEPPIGMNITTKSILPEVIMADLTGSMRYVPKLLFEKLPVLYDETNAVLHGYGPKEMKEREGQVPDDLEISVVGIGDAYVDSYPLQVTNFEKKSGLVNSINKIFPEGGGGGGLMESYELGLYFLLKHCEMSNVSENRPLCIIVGDEAFYDEVNRAQVESLIGDNLEQNLSTVKVIQELKKKFEVYILRPELTYGKDEYKKIEEKWKKVLDPQHVVKVEDPQRIVDDIVGINAIASNNFDKGLEMLKRRQKPEQVDVVLRDLHPLISSGKL
jgi:hypothetical protein